MARGAVGARRTQAVVDLLSAFDTFPATSASARIRAQAICARAAVLARGTSAIIFIDIALGSGKAFIACAAAISLA